MSTKRDTFFNSNLTSTIDIRSKSIARLSSTFAESKEVRNLETEGYDLRTYKDENGVVYYPWMFSKTMSHNPTTGFPLKSDVDALLKAIRSGSKEDILAIIQHEDSVRKFENPFASLSHQLIGTDSSVPALKTKDSTMYRIDGDDTKLLFEMCEVYAMSILRDTPFHVFKECDELNEEEYKDSHKEIMNIVKALNKFKSDDITSTQTDVEVTVSNLFRGLGGGEYIGPYISQFLLLPFKYGNLDVEQNYTYNIHDPSKTRTVDEWHNIQNGLSTDLLQEEQMLAKAYVYSARVLGTNVHKDPLYQFYYNAAQIALQNGVSLESETDLPMKSKNSTWTSGGGPSIFTNIAGVCEGALRVAWYQKYNVTMRVRPEVLAHRLKLAIESTLDVPGFDKIRSQYKITDPNLTGFKEIYDINSEKFKSELLNLQYPEGSPTHPSYPAGHACVAGAACTILKAMFKIHNMNHEQMLWPDIDVKHSIDGTQLDNYTGTDRGSLTIVGEFNKLASNASLGRDWAGVHYRSDGDCGLKLGENYAISYLVDKALEYHESHVGLFKGWTLEKFDGTMIKITSSGVVSLDN
jgi:hypothetical protein